MKRAVAVSLAVLALVASVGTANAERWGSRGRVVIERSAPTLGLSAAAIAAIILLQQQNQQRDTTTVVREREVVPLK